MNEFWKEVRIWRASVCHMFTLSVVFDLFFSQLFNNHWISNRILWSLLLSCGVISVIRRVSFSNWIIKKMRYTWRSVLFVLLSLPTLTFIAGKWNWFPMEQAGSWVMFLGIFFLIFAVTTIGYNIRWHIAGKKYDSIIGQYRKEKEESEKEHDA